MTKPTQTYSAKTVRNVHTVLKQALNHGVHTNLIARNPCDYVQLPKKEAIEYVIPTPAQLKALLSGLTRYTAYYPIFTWAVLGCRRGEALALFWQNIDFDANTISKVAIYPGKEFLHQIEQMQDDLNTAIPKALEVGGEIGGRIMKSNLARVVGKGTKYKSRSTGKLKDSLGVSPVKRNDSGTYDVKVGFAEGRGNVSNAMLDNVLEYGKSGQDRRRDATCRFDQKPSLL